MVRNVLFSSLQFYLSKNILLVTSLNSGWPLNDTTLLKWSEVESLGIWDNAIQMRSTEEDTYILLKIRLNGTSYDHLHDRALEVCRELFKEEKRAKKIISCFPRMSFLTYLLEVFSVLKNPTVRFRIHAQKQFSAFHGVTFHFNSVL